MLNKKYILHQLKLLFDFICQKYRRFRYRIKNRYFPSTMTPTIPDWALTEMAILGREIDPAIYPTEYFLAHCNYYAYPIRSQPGLIYGELMKQCKQNHYTHCFAIPWLKRGGADLITIMHINWIAQHKNSKVLVMLTEQGESPWLHHLPKQVDVIDISQYIYQVSHAELLSILLRLIIQLPVAVLHIINSRHAWDLVSKYGLALNQTTRIFASLYCDDYDEFGQPVGFARQYLPSCHPYIQTIFSDNKRFPNLLHQTYGYPISLFKVLNTPVQEQSSALASSHKSSPRVLWAGRLDKQKRPDILIKIAQAMPDITFHVYGSEVLGEKNGFQSQLKKIHNIVLYGSFEGAQSLPFTDFPVFLYTSHWDGLPTIVLTAGAHGIPIVASAVGEIQHLITEDMGFPILQIESIEDYVHSIRYILEQPNESYRRAKNFQRYIKNHHTNMNFERAMRAVPGYIHYAVEECYEINPCD